VPAGCPGTRTSCLDRQAAQKQVGAHAHPADETTGWTAAPGLRSSWTFHSSSVALSIAGIAVVGSLLGSWLSSRVPERGLRKGFGIFVLVMAALVVIQETLKTLG